MRIPLCWKTYNMVYLPGREAVGRLWNLPQDDKCLSFCKGSAGEMKRYLLSSLTLGREIQNLEFVLLNLSLALVQCFINKSLFPPFRMIIYFCTTVYWKYVISILIFAFVGFYN